MTHDDTRSSKTTFDDRATGDRPSDGTHGMTAGVQGSVLSHGDWDHQEQTHPRFGTGVKVSRVSIYLAPSHPFEVNFKAPSDVITFSYSGLQVDAAYDSDKVSEYTIYPTRLHFHPEGSSIYARTEDQTGGIVQIDYQPDIRRTLEEEFGQEGADFVDRTEINIKTPRPSELARMAISLVLKPDHQTALAVESVGFLVMSEALSGVLGAEKVQTAAGPGLDHARLSRVLDLIDDQLDRDVTLRDMASVAGLSPFHFSRSFKVATGYTPHQYVIERRLVRARHLLTTTEMTLADIAYSVGFSSQAHMTDMFRNKLGVTPAGYRKAFL